VNLARFATRHARFTLFAMLVLCLAGGWMLGQLPASILPDVSFPRLVAIAESGDRPAEMMVTDIARPLEEAIATVHGVTRIRSKTQRGATEISIDFAWGTDMLAAMQLIDGKISEARPQLPPDTDVAVEQMNPTMFPILGLSLYSKSLSQAELWSLATYVVRPRLTRVPGVAQVVVQGGRTPEIGVEVNPERLTAYGLSLQDVEEALSQANVITGVGRMDWQFQQYHVVVSGRMADPAALADVVVSQRGGVPIRLGQLAAVKESVGDRVTVVTADGQESVLVNIVRQPDANTIAVADAVGREMAQLKPLLPAGVTVKTFYDQSVLVRDAVGSVRDAVLIGVLLSVIVLFLFLGDVRATLLTAFIIPATLLISFLFMRLAGLTLNLMTLGALAVAIGLVIDDAIVVVENIFRHLAHGDTPRATVQLAIGEIAKPMLFATATTSVVFLPLVLLTGVTGVFFAGLAITMVIALVVSLVLALLVSPGLCARFLRVRRGAEDHGPLFSRLIGLYEHTIRFGLRARRLLPVAILAILALTAFVGLRLGTGFMPAMDEGSFVLDYRTPPGTSLEESNRVLLQIEELLRKTPEVSAYSRRTGTELGFAITEPNTGDFAVMLKPGRRRNIEDVMDRLREQIAARVPGVEVDFIEVLQDLIGDLAGAPAPVEVKLYGEDQAQLAALATEVTAKVEKIPGAVDVKSSLVESGPELVVHVDPTKTGRAGLTTEAVATQANAALFGDVVTQLMQGDRPIGVRVRYPAAWRADRPQLAALPIRTPGGFTLPLSAVARIETIAGTTEIDREDQRRVASVTARLSGRDLGGVMRDVQALMRAQTLPPGVTYAFGGQFQSQAESFRGLMVVLVLAVLLVFGTLVFQFESFTPPLVILLIMPLSLFGVVLGLSVTGTPLNVSSFMGAIMLIGIVGENGILLLDQVRKAEAGGLSLEEAAVQAGRTRLRPILMTTLTAILALTPLALGIGAGAEMQKPLAIAVISGLALATIFTLLFAPVLYVGLRGRRTRSAKAEASR
jgi:CzcA family heavy metal efflux pump